MNLLRRLRSIVPPAGLGAIARVVTPESVCALTFDDGPDPVSTPALLKVLANHGAKATFFLDGPAAERHPELVHRIAEQGHVVGSHGWAHQSAAQSKGMSGFTSQLRDIRRAGWAIGQPTKFYRPPFGHESRWTRLAVAAARQRIVYWSASVHDWDVVSSSELAQRIGANLCPGTILLLHDRLRHATDPAAFDRRYMIDAVDDVLRKSGDDIRFVTLPELLAAGVPVIRFRHRTAPPLAEMVEQSIT